MEYPKVITRSNQNSTNCEMHFQFPLSVSVPVMTFFISDESSLHSNSFQSYYSVRFAMALVYSPQNDAAQIK